VLHMPDAHLHISNGSPLRAQFMLPGQSFLHRFEPVPHPSSAHRRFTTGAVGVTMAKADTSPAMSIEATVSRNLCVALSCNLDIALLPGKGCSAAWPLQVLLPNRWSGILAQDLNAPEPEV
jgi:hypothetical protein